MIKKLLLLSIFLTFGILFCQVPHGSIHVDVTKILNNESLILLKNKKSLDSVLLKNDISIFPSYAVISKLENINSLKIGYFENQDLMKFESINLQDINKNIVGLYDGWVNFSYNKNIYHVTKIKKKDEKMILYLYVRNNESIKTNQKSFEILNVYYDLIEFTSGTYIVDIHNFISDDDVSEYYKVENSNLYIKNQAIILSKISEQVVLPEDLQKFYKNKNLKRPETVEKILSVFDNK